MSDALERRFATERGYTAHPLPSPPTPPEGFGTPPQAPSSTFTRDARKTAFADAGQLLRDAYVDHNTEDLLVVASWLVTGSADLALQFSEQRARFYAEHRERDLTTADSATCSPDQADEPSTKFQRAAGHDPGVQPNWSGRAGG